MLDDLAALGIDYDDVIEVLENEGVQKFEDAWTRSCSRACRSSSTPPRLAAEPQRADAERHSRRGAPTADPAPAEQAPAAAGPVPACAASPHSRCDRNPLRDPRDRRLPRVPEPCALVVFGVTGDLSRKKLLPAIYDLANRGLLPADFVLLGFARRDWGDGDFESLAKKAAKEHARTDWNEEVWERLSGDIMFVPGSFDDDEAFDTLAQTLDELCQSHGIKGNAAFYLSIPPSMFPTVLKQMERTEHGRQRRAPAAGGASSSRSRSGTTCQSALELNKLVDDVFTAARRLPHRPLPGQGDGPEPDGAAVRQPAVRAGLERQLRRLGADHHGRGRRHRRPRRVLRRHRRRPRRAAEPPAAAARPDRDGGAGRVHRRGDPDREAQGAAGDHAAARPRRRTPSAASTTRAGRPASGSLAYTAEKDVPADSTTETYAAVRLGIDTRRWAGVPFYLRTGKRLPRRVTEIAVLFKKAPHLPFSQTDTEELGHNQLVIRVQPDEGVTLKFGSKVPGSAMEVRDVAMDFLYGEAFTESSPEAYERLILDVLLGDATLFPRNAEVEASWRVIDPLEEFWAGQPPVPVPRRRVGTEGGRRDARPRRPRWRRP